MVSLLPDQIDPERFAAALRAALGRERMTQAALARELDVSQPTVSDWVNAKKTPGIDNLARLQEVLDVPGEAIRVAAPSGPDENDIVLVPRVAYAEAGNGYVNSEPLIEERHAYSRRELQRLTNVSPERLMEITVVGDSMAPEIPPNTPVLYRPVHEISDHGIYVLIYDGSVIVKKVQRFAGGALKLIPANPSYDPEMLVPVPEADTPNTYRSQQTSLAATLRVLGKVVGYFRAV
jgi:phage repressor protein C with HTH and peptisase S24 domain